jgi:excisionase family DNA binding protein
LSALADELRVVVREVLRDELPRLLAELRQPAANETDLLDVNAAAQRLGLSTSTIYKRCASGALPCVKDGSRVLFRPADLDAYAEARQRSPERVCAILDAYARRVPKRTDGHVYFLCGQIGLIKIGWALNVENRTAILQTGSAEPLEVIASMPGTPADERALHRKFALLLVRGEWFRPIRHSSTTSRKIHSLGLSVVSAAASERSRPGSEPANPRAASTRAHRERPPLLA